MTSENPNTPSYWDAAYRDECEQDAEARPGYKRDYGPIHAAIVTLMPEAGRVLDIGCGPGLLCRRMKTLKPHLAVTGVDFSSFVIDKNRQRDAALGIDYRCIDIRDSLRELGGGWDAITMCEVLEHLERPHEIVPRIVALLREGGGFALTSPHDHRVPSVEHLRAWGHDEIFHLLEPHSDAVTFRHFPPPFDRWVLAAIEHSPQPFTPALSANPGRQRDEELLQMKTTVQTLRKKERTKAVRIDRLLDRVRQRDLRIAALEDQLEQLRRSQGASSSS